MEIFVTVIICNDVRMAPTVIASATSIPSGSPENISENGSFSADSATPEIDRLRRAEQFER